MAQPYEAHDDVFSSSRQLEFATVGEILYELYVSKISVSLSWTSGSGVTVKLFDATNRLVAADSFPGGVVAAVEWLRDAAYDHYRDCAAFPEG